MQKRFDRSTLRPLARILASGLAVFALSTAAIAVESELHPRANSYMKRHWGIEVVHVRQASAGYMLEFRYRVLDASKAQALFERQTKPILNHIETGAKLIVPTPAKTGALRNSNPPKTGNTYWMFFANPGKLVDQDDLVSIEIGEFLVENLVVQ